MKKTLKIIGSILLVVPALIYLYRLFSSSQVVTDKAPNEAARAQAEQELQEIKKQVDETENKQYSDEELLERFNKKH